MGQGSGRNTRSPVQVARSMWLAHRYGRIEEMLTAVHPEVLWRPATPLSQSEYKGHAGVLAMFDEFEQETGKFRMDLIEVTQLPDGRVQLVGRVVQLTEGGDVVGPLQSTFFTLRDGLVVTVEGELQET